MKIILFLLAFLFVFQAQAATCASGHTQTDAELIKILSKWPSNSQAERTTMIITN